MIEEGSELEIGAETYHRMEAVALGVLVKGMKYLHKCNLVGVPTEKVSAFLEQMMRTRYIIFRFRQYILLAFRF